MMANNNNKIIRNNINNRVSNKTGNLVLTTHNSKKYKISIYLAKHYRNVNLRRHYLSFLLQLDLILRLV